MMAEQRKLRKAFAPPPPPGYVLVSDARPLMSQYADSSYWIALASSDACPLGVLLYEPGHLIAFLVPDETPMLRFCLAEWQDQLNVYIQPALMKEYMQQEEENQA